MKYGSVCSGIEAATAAWHHLGWQPAFFSEIEPFPRAVLAHHYPTVPLHGDFTTIGADQYGAIDLLVGGTPCQSFSVAGLRGGLDDDRGNLALEFLRLADRKRPRWVVWENVPGVLSSDGGRDFGSILGGLGELGYGFAYRVLDAQYFGVAQRRRRVFVVGYLGDWRRAAAVLFERHSLSGHPAPSREKGQGFTDRIAPSVVSNGDAHSGFRDEKGLIAQKVTYPIDTQNMTEGHNSGGKGFGAEIDPSFTLTKGHSHAVAVAFGIEDGLAHCLRSGASKADKPDSTTYVAQPAAFQSSQSGVRVGDTHATLDANNGSRRHNGIATASAVRRLTPRECERLQGFPDDYTAIPWRKKGSEDCPDGPRYKALGNSMAVPVMRWIGERIAAVETIIAVFPEAEVVK